VLATPNLPEAWYPAIVARPSRFDRRFEISLSRERERYLAGKFGAQLDANAREEIVRLTSGMSMAFLQEIFVVPRCARWTAGARRTPKMRARCAPAWCAMRARRIEAPRPTRRPASRADHRPIPLRAQRAAPKRRAARTSFGCA